MNSRNNPLNKNSLSIDVNAGNDLKIPNKILGNYFAK